MRRGTASGSHWTWSTLLCMASFTIKYVLYRHAVGPRLILSRVSSTKCSLWTVIFHRLYWTQLSVVSGWLVGAEGKGEAYGTVVGEGLVDPFSGVSHWVSLSPNVPLSPSRETKQEAGGSVVAFVEYLYVGHHVPFNDVPTDGRFVVVGYLYVGNHVPFNDVPTDGGFVVAKTVKTISSVICQYFYETCKKD